MGVTFLGEVSINTVVEVNTRYVDQKEAKWDASIADTKNKLLYVKYEDMMNEGQEQLIQEDFQKCFAGGDSAEVKHKFKPSLIKYAKQINEWSEMHVLYEAQSTMDHEGVNLLLKSVNVGVGIIKAYLQLDAWQYILP